MTTPLPTPPAAAPALSGGTNLDPTTAQLLAFTPDWPMLALVFRSICGLPLAWVCCRSNAEARRVCSAPRASMLAPTASRASEASCSRPLPAAGPSNSSDALKASLSGSTGRAGLRASAGSSQ